MAAGCAVSISENLIRLRTKMPILCHVWTKPQSGADPGIWERGGSDKYIHNWGRVEIDSDIVRRNLSICSITISSEFFCPCLYFV